MPRLTVITPVFNGIGYISSCIENVRSQGIEDIEHLIVDGASTDGTGEYVSALLAVHPHLRLISEKDSGQSDAMNKGVRLAQADVISFLNVDDFYAPGAIAEGLEFLKRRPDVDFVAGNCRVIDENDKLIHLNTPSDLRIESLLLGREYAQLPENPSCYFYRKHVHTLVGEYDVTEHYSLDTAFILACAAKVRMAYVPRLWGNFRLMPGTKTYINARSGGGAKRRKELRAMWLDRLSPAQRRHMAVIKFEKRVKQKIMWFFTAIERRLAHLVPGPVSRRG